MRIDASPLALAEYASNFQELKKLRASDADGNRSPESKRAAHKLLTLLKQIRAQIHNQDPSLKLDANGYRKIQERGIELQLTFLNCLFQNPREFLKHLPEYQAEHSLSKAELEILKTVAEESLYKQALIEAATARFLRSARKKLGREKDDQTIDDALRLEVGRQIFEARVSREPEGNVYWESTPLAMTIEVEKLDDVQQIDPSLPDGHFLPQASFWSGIFRIQNLPFLFFRQGSTKTFRHELNHAQNHLLKAGLERTHPKLRSHLFGKELPVPTRLDKSSVKIMEKASQEIDHIIENVRENGDVVGGAIKIEEILKPGLMEDGLTQAKNELIADFDAVGDFSYLNQLLIHPLTRNESKPTRSSIQPKNKNAYHYLSYFGLDPSHFADVPELYDQVTASYNQVLRDNVGFLDAVWQLHQGRPDANTWHQRILAFMRQTPLMLWQESGRELFAADYHLLRFSSDDKASVKPQPDLPLLQPKSVA